MSLSAVHQAVQFLMSARSNHGWWRDFDTYAGISDAWVSAYTACVLAKCGEPGCSSAAQGILDQLMARNPDQNGWSYNARVPPDADTTIWVCRLAEALGLWPARCDAAIDFL